MGGRDYEEDGKALKKGIRQLGRCGKTNARGEDFCHSVWSTERLVILKSQRNPPCI